MMNAVGNGLAAAFLLARGRADAMNHVETGLDGAARSFVAAIICLPGFLCLRLLDWADGEAPLQIGHALTLDLLGDVIAWAGFALISRQLAALLGRSAQWPRYIAAWNWCNVAQYGLWAAASLPGLVGAPEFVQQIAGLVALGWGLWLEWYATRLALEIDILPAVALVAVDFSLMLAIDWVTSVAAALSR
jgi:hypothetical protein